MQLKSSSDGCMVFVAVKGMSSAGATLRPIREDLELSTCHSNGAGGPPYSPELITIYLAVLGAPVIPMRVLESDSIASVKLKVQSCKGFAAKKQKLVFDGREMARNDCLVRDYGVADGNVLHLIIKTSDLRVITVKTASGKKLKFRVDRGRTVRHVNKQVADLEDEQCVFQGRPRKQLQDRKEIHDICTNNNAFIHLLVHRSAEAGTGAVENDLEPFFRAPVADSRPPGRDALIEPVIVNPKVELPRLMKDLLGATLSGLDKGNPPIMSSEGTGGTYFMQDITGNEYVAVFKPIDEEPLAENNPRGLPPSTNGEGLKRGTRVGEGALREVAAYILDHPVSGRRSFSHVDFGFAGVPPTVMARCLHGGFNHPTGCDHEAIDFKMGSLQMFVKNYGSCEDMGTRAFPAQEVHKICVLDIRLANADRHAGNILVFKEGEGGRLALVPIDHGYCLPENVSLQTHLAFYLFIYLFMYDLNSLWNLSVRGLHIRVALLASVSPTFQFRNHRVHKVAGRRAGHRTAKVLWVGDVARVRSHSSHLHHASQERRRKRSHSVSYRKHTV